MSVELTEFSSGSPFFSKLVRQPSTYPGDEKQQLQPYEIAYTPSGGPPFHHDILAHIISYVSSDLETLKSVSAVRRSWRFFANYHHGWRRFEVQHFQKHLEKDAFTDLKKDRVVLKKLHGRREQPIPFVRDNLHGSVTEKVKTIEEKRPGKAYYLLGSNDLPISTPLFLLSFVIFAILGCFNIAVGGNHDSDHGLDGRSIFQRRGEDDKTGFNDGRVYLVGYSVARKTEPPVYLNMRMCNGYVEETTTCSPCKCQSSSSSSNSNSYGSGSSYGSGRNSGRSSGGYGSSYRRQLNNQTREEEREDGLSHQGGVQQYYSRRSGGCTCCSTTTYWNKCTTVEGSATFDNCPDLTDVAKNAVQWNLIHGICALLSPVVFVALVGLVSCGAFCTSATPFVPAADQKNIKFRVLSLFFAFPAQLCLMATAAFSLHYADRLGKTPCSGWEELMKNDGGGDTIKASGNGWSTDHNVRLMTVPLVISLVVGTVTVLVYGCWFSAVIAARPQRKYQNVS